MKKEDWISKEVEDRLNSGFSRGKGNAFHVVSINIESSELASRLELLDDLIFRARLFSDHAAESSGKQISALAPILLPPPSESYINFGVVAFGV